MSINLDLYEYYKSRKDGLNLKNYEEFYVCLRILLACDVVHDFIAPRGDAGRTLWQSQLGQKKEAFADYKQRFLEDNANRVIEDCVQVAGAEKVLRSIEERKSRTKSTGTFVDRLINLFRSEDMAKKTADAIHDFLGFTEQNVQEAMLRSNPCADFSILDLIKTLDIVKSSGKSHTASTNYNITIDATSDKTNLTPFFSELMNRAYKRKNNCNTSNDINIINSYATQYDSSNDDALTKIFSNLGFLKGDLERDLEFDIICGPLSVFNGSLKKEGGKVNLTVNSYFKEIFKLAKKRGSDSTDSVNGITKDMLISYTSPSSPPRELLNLTIFKTMGDFLQIMTHMFLSKHYLQNDINVFVTFDILCAKIAGILDKNVFYEKKFTKDPDKISGLYTFFTETARDERTSALSLIDMSAAPRGPESASWLVDDAEMSDWLPSMYNFVSPDGNSGGTKRSRNRFGKKKPKVKNLPNKALMTKLKSVGIKITKKQGKRRVYLSRPELIKRATAFRNLQLRAKKLKVRIMYKNKKGKYVYKTAKRLMNDIKRQMKKPVNKRMKKPVKKQMKKSAKKPNAKQIKQRFG